jgi:hypothetical protein
MNALSLKIKKYRNFLNGFIVNITPVFFAVITGGPAVLVPVVVKYCKHNLPHHRINKH